MTLSSSNELLENIGNLVHQDTQLQEHCLDLTVSEICEFSKSGSLDFGGSEFEPATTQKLEIVKKDSDDDYGWWTLAGGTYLAICNETIDSPDDKSILIVPHKHAREAGLIVNPVIAERDDAGKKFRLPIQVPEIGCKIKENARFASAYNVNG